MNRPARDGEEVPVEGFEIPRSPDSSYDNVYPVGEDKEEKLPTVPPHLPLTTLNCPPTRDPSASLPLPLKVSLNHLYVDNKETPSSVVGFGVTQRYRSKFVTVVLYKPAPRSGSGSGSA